MTHSKTLIAVSSIAAVLALGACSKTEPTASTPSVDTTVATTPAPASSNTDISAADATKTSGAGAMDGSFDATITAKVNAGLAADKDLSAIKINVDTKDGVVTLTGPAPSAAAKDRAGEIAKNVKDVKSVNNQLSAG